MVREALGEDTICSLILGEPLCRAETSFHQVVTFSNQTSKRASHVPVDAWLVPGRCLLQSISFSSRALPSLTSLLWRLSLCLAVQSHGDGWLGRKQSIVYSTDTYATLKAPAHGTS